MVMFLGIREQELFNKLDYELKFRVNANFGININSGRSGFDIWGRFNENPS